jgi:hypothetical protein
MDIYSDDACRAMAERAKQLYDTYVSKEGIYDYIELLCTQIAQRYDIYIYIFFLRSDTSRPVCMTKCRFVPAPTHFGYVRPEERYLEDSRRPRFHLNHSLSEHECIPSNRYSEYITIYIYIYIYIYIDIDIGRNKPHHLDARRTTGSSGNRRRWCRRCTEEEAQERVRQRNQEQQDAKYKRSKVYYVLIFILSRYIYIYKWRRDFKSSRDFFFLRYKSIYRSHFYLCARGNVFPAGVSKNI